MYGQLDISSDLLGYDERVLHEVLEWRHHGDVVEGVGDME